MKWYKHISDSLDDPFIFDLMTKYGSDGYTVFFGTLEIYSREFHPESDGNLVISWSFLRQKLRMSCSKIKKILMDIHKWDVKDNGDTITIFIPKFIELADEWTQRKVSKARELLGSDSGVTREKLQHDIDKEEDIRLQSPPFQEIVTYLNQKSGKNFSPKTASTQKHIKARFAEGRTLQNFMSVIDIKVKQWKADPKMSPFLRPETLFGTKFEGYLQEAQPQGNDWTKT